MKPTHFKLIVILLGITIAAVPASAVKKVPKPDIDSSGLNAPQTAPEKTPKSLPVPEQQPNSQPTKSQPVIPSQPPAPRDNFIDRDGDGINDDIHQRKPPEIKRDNTEPPRVPPVKIDRSKDNDKTPEPKVDDAKKKHRDK